MPIFGSNPDIGLGVGEIVGLGEGLSIRYRAIRRKGLELTLQVQPRISHRSPPCKFCDCILQAAIDFAALRKRGWSSRSTGWAGMERNALRSSAWPALYLSFNF